MAIAKVGRAAEREGRGKQGHGLERETELALAKQSSRPTTIVGGLI